MLFKPRGIQPQKEEKPKNQMTLADMLAFRDTWTEIPSEDFSVERILLKARLEKQRKAEVPKLVTSENGFRVRDRAEMEESEIELRRFQGALNKLTENNFESVSREVLSEDLISNLIVLKGAVNIVFSKAVAEPVFSNLYARFCARIANYEQEVVAKSESDPVLRAKLESIQKELTPAGAEKPTGLGTFARIVLVSRSQEFYNQYINQETPQNAEEEEHHRKQNMANIKFLGECYLKSVISVVPIISIASYCLALGWEKHVIKTTVSNVDLEMMYNLFLVIGKRFDETTAQNVVTAIWDPIYKYANDNAFSMRIRCLLQNLVDLRKNAWKPKDKPASGAETPGEEQGKEQHRSGAQQQQQQHQQHQQHQQQQQQRNTMHRAASMQNQDGSNRRNVHANPMAGVRRGERITSFPDLGQFGDGNTSLPPPPPPPLPQLTHDEPPPPFPGTVPPVSDEDKRLMVLAQPPASLTSEVEQTTLSILRDACVDGDWNAAAASLADAVPGEQKHTCIMCAAYSAIKKICMSNNEEDREVFSKALDNSTLFDVSALARGYSWFLADAVANNYKEDVPRVTSRFVHRLVNTKSMSFLVMIRDVMARTANYLDALYVHLGGGDYNWDDDFIDIWSNVLEEWTKARGDDAEVKDAAKVVDCLAAVKQRPFMRDIAPDFLMELNQTGVLTNDAVQQWIETNGKDERHRAFSEQLEQLFA